jgi:hypothetical protein
MHTERAFELRAEAASVHRELSDYVALALRTLRRDAGEVASANEPGTSQTTLGVEELTISLDAEDARWLHEWASSHGVSASAVIGVAVEHFRLHGPALRRYAEPWSTITRSRQDCYYRELAQICEDVEAHRCSPDEADARIASAVVGRVMHVVPQAAWPEIHAAVRELCINHAALRAANGRLRSWKTIAGVKR